ncbi:MAG: DUF5011 domain-containing protein [Lachnospiraceae bacterium]|nr:DUF5011 domain-containing protein [Lachnospiraceae bacterium]
MSRMTHKSGRLLAAVMVVVMLSFILPAQTLKAETGTMSAIHTENAQETNANTNSYYSSTNAPEFYGTTQITVPVGTKFDWKDARFRIFAKDFEDGDLTDSIVVTQNTVDTSAAGQYSIGYQVTDTHGNKTEITVPVTVTSGNNEIILQKTMYSLPSVDHLNAAGTARGHNHDRQILGVYMNAGSKISMRQISGDSSIVINGYNNDSQTEPAAVNLTSEWKTMTLEGYGFVPFAKTLYKQNTPVVYEIKYTDSGVSPLNYYHYKDDEAAFKSSWESDTNTYGVIEGASLTVVVPYADRGKLTGYYNNHHDTLDGFLEYWDAVTQEYDEFLGLSYAAENPLDQNVKAKYFVRANAHGAGSAYYAGDHVGINNASVASFFEVNWGGLHEFAHGYQGGAGKNGMPTGEVTNNILGHYVQINRNIYKYNNDWLGSIESIEQGIQNQRLQGKKFSGLDSKGMLYVLVNLLDTFNPKEAYGAIYSYYRRCVAEGRTPNMQDTYILALNEKYGVNLIPYFESWGISVSEDTRYTINSGNSKGIYYLKDLVVDAVQAATIKETLGKKGIYSLVTNDELKSNNISQTVKIDFQIEDFTDIQNKYIKIKDGKKLVAKIRVTGQSINANLPIGVYNVELPKPNHAYEYNNDVLIVTNQPTSVVYSYKRIQHIYYNNNVRIYFGGYWSNDAAVLEMEDDELVIRYNTGRALTYNYNLVDSNTAYASICVEDINGNLVYENHVYGGMQYFTSSSSEVRIPVSYGDKIKLYRYMESNKNEFYSTLTGEKMTDYNMTDKQWAVYDVTDCGLIKSGITTDDFYMAFKSRIDAYITAFQRECTEEDIYNSYYRLRDKITILNAIDSLIAMDREPYADLRMKLTTGYFPTVQGVKNPEFKKGTSIDLYSLITAEDYEDGKINITKDNTVIDSGNLDMNVPGNYEIRYEVSDNDGNITTYNMILKVIQD